MAELQAVGSVKKLNNQNYNTWSTCMESYLQGQDLWEIVAGSETTPLDNDQALQKWKVKAGKAMFAIKTSIEEEMLEHIRRADTPKAARDTFATLFSKKNNSLLKKKRWQQLPLWKKTEMALAMANLEQVNYREDWIVDSGCSNHMTGNKEKLQNMSKYKGKKVVVTADNTRLPIAHIGETLILPRFNAEQVPLEQVYHVPGVKKNLLSVAQLAGFSLWSKVYLNWSVVKIQFMLAGCQYGKAHQLPYQESKFSAREPLELVHSSKAMEEIQVIEKEGEPESREITQSPWQMGVHHRTPKEDQPRQEEVIEKEESPQPQLRRSMRHHKANHSGEFEEKVVCGGDGSESVEGWSSDYSVVCRGAVDDEEVDSLRDRLWVS
uniref:Uncharacterized protein n=1 Tax=Fagus sylvatica TaxID=28930 RepID=A0A2N9HLQ3_FAGSY